MKVGGEVVATLQREPVAHESAESEAFPRSPAAAGDKASRAQRRLLAPDMSLLSRLHEVVVRVGPLGFVAFGGPAINIILFRRLFVLSDRPWLDSTTFADLFSLSGALPGPGSTQLLFSIGLIRGGVLPGLLCFFLFS